MVQIKEKIINIVNTPGRIGVLSTVDADCLPNAAYFGSPRLEPDGTFVMALGDNRTLENLENNPHAVFVCITEAPVTPATPGVRLYLKLQSIQREGEMFEQMVENIRQVAGDAAAGIMRAAASFEVTEVRPIMALSK
jgi:hypothetical protein